MSRQLQAIMPFESVRSRHLLGYAFHWESTILAILLVLPFSVTVPSRPSLACDGIVTTFAVPDATATFAYQLNTSNQIIGYYIDSGGMKHGYTRDSAGVLTYPIDVPGATETLLLGNNDSNWGVGKYTDTLGVTHGLFYVTPDDILTYDYPGATYTSLNGINKDGLICGYYNDAAGVSHGFVARVNLTGSGKPNTNAPMAPVKPAYALPRGARDRHARLVMGTSVLNAVPSLSTRLTWLRCCLQSETMP